MPARRLEISRPEVVAILQALKIDRPWCPLAPVTRRSRSNIRETIRNARRSIASSPTANKAATANVGWITPIASSRIAIARFFDMTVDKMFDSADEEAGT